MEYGYVYYYVGAPHTAEARQQQHILDSPRTFFSHTWNFRVSSVRHPSELLQGSWKGKKTPSTTGSSAVAVAAAATAAVAAAAADAAAAEASSSTSSSSSSTVAAAAAASAEAEAAEDAESTSEHLRIPQYAYFITRFVSV